MNPIGYEVRYQGAINQLCVETLEYEQENSIATPFIKEVRGFENARYKVLSSELYDAVIKHVESENIQNLFENLAGIWKAETAFESNYNKIVNNQSYLQIIGLGKDVLPFIFDDLQKSNSLWFCALNAITRANPIQNEHIGNVLEMSKDWLNWAKINNYI